MSEPSSDDPQARRAVMSALADGEASAAAQGCALWRTDAAAREAWHTYHLIGDAMRSSELGSTREIDLDFLAAVRVRLAAEPAVIALATPARAAVPQAGRRHWLAPAAVAAGLVVVAGALVVSRVATPGGGGAAGPLLASKPQPPAASAGQALLPASADPLGDPQWQVANGQLIRDARLDSYLRAHRAGQAALPGGATGRFETVVLER